MDIKAYLLEHKRPLNRLPFLEQQAHSLVTQHRDFKPPYKYLYLMVWVGPVNYPQGGKLGDDSIVWAHNGDIWTAPPGVSLPPQTPMSVPQDKVEGMLDDWARVASQCSRTARYVTLLRDHLVPEAAQKQAILIGSYAACAINPDGSTCKRYYAVERSCTEECTL